MYSEYYSRDSATRAAGKYNKKYFLALRLPVSLVAGCLNDAAHDISFNLSTAVNLSVSVKLLLMLSHAEIYSYQGRPGAQP
jgi:hypothetical protein